MRVQREFQQEDVVRFLEVIDEDMLALLLANIPNQDALTEEQRRGAVIAEKMDRFREKLPPVPTDTIVQWVRNSRDVGA